MPIEITLSIFAGAIALVATISVGTLTITLAQLHRLDAKFDTLSKDINGKFEALRRDLAEEFRVQRAEVLAQTTALANAITAARR